MDKQGKVKQPISQFEFAIMELADPERAKFHRPFTDEEKRSMLEDLIKSNIQNFKVLKP